MANKKTNIEEREFEQISNLLKSLPKVKTPDDFEFKLMTKIRNNRFESSGIKESANRKTWIYLPAAAFVFSVVLVLFFVNRNLDEEVQPLQIPMAAEIAEDSYIKNESGGDDKTTINASASSQNIAQPAYRVAVNNNDAVIMQGRPFSSRESVNLDEYIENDSALPMQGSSALRSAGTASDYREFRGFDVGKPDGKSVEILKAKFDSLRKEFEAGKLR